MSTRNNPPRCSISLCYGRCLLEIIHIVALILYAKVGVY